MKTNPTRPDCSSNFTVRGSTLELFLIAILLFLSSADSGFAATRYVWQSSPSPAPPYTNWVSAARVIQDAVDAAAPGDEIIVTNGTYATGGRALGTWFLVNRVMVDKPLSVRSVNGPQFTVIEGAKAPNGGNGDGAVRCVYLADRATLFGFTLTNGATRGLNAGDDRETSGGGVYCVEYTNALVTNCVIVGSSAGHDGGAAYGATLNNCVLTGNSANDFGGGASGGMLYNCTLSGNSAIFGGGASGCMLYNCTLSGNRAFGFYADWGGGAYSCTLNNCTLIDNWADNEGGGAASCTLNNCILYFNTAGEGPNYWGGELIYCCTTPQPWWGVGNITNAPLFVDYAGGNLRLQSNSPCINAGRNTYAPGRTDLDGNPRIVNGTVDIGAYEFQGPGSAISYAWLQQFGLPTDGSADAADPDADGHNNWQEWRCQTCPTNHLSALRLLSATPAGTNVTVSWQSVAGVSYSLERSTNLTSPFSLLTPNLPGQSGTTTFTDTNAASLIPLFYRVGAE